MTASATSWHPFLRSVAAVASGSAVAQALTLALAPVLARLYDPTDFGALGAFAAIVSTIGVVACLRLDLAIVVPERSEDARTVALAALVTAVATASVAATLVVVVHVLGVGSGTSIGALLPLVPIAVLASGTFQVGTQWLARVNRFGVVARSHVIRSIVANGLPIMMFPLGIGALALASGTVLGGVAAALYAATRGFTRLFRRLPTVSRVATALRDTYGSYSHFALYGSPQALLNALNQAVPIAVLGIGFDVATIGYYTLSHRVLKAPVNLLGQSIRQVLYPRLARSFQTGGTARMAVLMTMWMSAMTIVPVIAVGAFGPRVFAFVFGEPWSTAGTFASLSALWVASTFVNVPAVSLIPLLGMQRLHSAFEMVYIIARVVALLAGVALGSAVIAIGASAAVGFAFNVWLIVVVIRRTAAHDKRTHDAPA